MFAIQQLSGRLAFGLAAAALAITALATPASAQLNENAGKLAVADISVKKNGIAPLPPGNPGTKAAFLVTNSSPRTVTVKITKQAHLYSTLNHEHVKKTGEAEETRTLGPNEAVNVWIGCALESQTYCGSFILRATYPLDPNTQNDWDAYPYKAGGY